MNNKLQYAEMKVNGFTKRYEDKYIQKIDGYLLAGKMNYISVSYDEKNEMIDVIATIVHNNYEEKARLGRFCLRYNEGTLYGKKDKEYKRLAYFQKAIIKIWEEKMNDDFCLTAGLYEMNELPKWLKTIEEENKKQGLIAGDEDVQKYTKQLAGATTPEKIIDALEEIFINEDFYIGDGKILADYFNEDCVLGVTMDKKFGVLVDAVIAGKLELEKITSTCERMRESYNYDALTKYDIKFVIIAYMTKKIKPEYDWFMKENQWNGTRTIVDEEKIDALKNEGYVVELVPEYEEVILYGVDEQLEGQLGLEDIEIKEEEVVEMEKEIKISIDGEGRVEKITTNSIDDANSNLKRRIKEVVDGIAYCNKTWITIDIKEFEQPIEFRVDLIERLHGNVDDVLKLIIEEEERKCKYVSENKEKCTWIKDTDKFISVRKELIQVLEGYLLPEPTIEVEEGQLVKVVEGQVVNLKNNKKEEVKEMKEINKRQLGARLTKLGKQLIDVKSVEKIEEIVYSIFPNAMEVGVEENCEIIHFLVGEDYIGANPTKAEMKKIDENFSTIQKTYGLDVYVEIEKRKIKLTSSLGVDYSNKWGHKEFADVAIKEVVVEIETNDNRALNEKDEIMTSLRKEEISAQTAINNLEKLLEEKEKLSEGAVQELEQALFRANTKKENKEREDAERAVKRIKAVVATAYNEGKADAEKCIEKLKSKIEKNEKYPHLVKELQDEIEIYKKENKEVEEEYLPDYRILTQGDRAIDIVRINVYNSDRHIGGLTGTKIIKFAQGYFYNGDIKNKLPKEQIKELESCGLDMDKEVEIAKRIIQEFNNEQEIEKFKKYKLNEYYVKETGNLCIDTGSMMYKIIDGAPTSERVKKFLEENKEYDMKLFNDKYVAIPHYVIYRR